MTKARPQNGRTPPENDLDQFHAVKRDTRILRESHLRLTLRGSPPSLCAGLPTPQSRLTEGLP